MKPIFSKTILVVLALSVAACSSTPVRRSMKETWNDSLTASKIRYKMMRDSEVKKSRMHIEVFRGLVTLTGRSVNDAEKVRAETLAKSVKRVTGVENYIHVVGGYNTAVAKAPVVGVPPVAVSPKAGVALGPVIQEETIVADKAKTSPDDIPATLPTIRESTGRPAAAPVAPVAGPKAATAVAKNGKLATAKPAKPETRLATVRKAPAPVTTAKVKAPGVAPVSAAAVTPSPVQVAAPAATPLATPAKVVGQSKTGLPWDGEVYEDDASRVTGQSAVPKAAAASRTPIKSQMIAPAPAPSAPPATTPPPATGDDLAKEAAQELEKLRQKK